MANREQREQSREEKSRRPKSQRGEGLTVLEMQASGSVKIGAGKKGDARADRFAAPRRQKARRADASKAQRSSTFVCARASRRSYAIRRAPGRRSAAGGSRPTAPGARSRGSAAA